MFYLSVEELLLSDLSPESPSAGTLDSFPSGDEISGVTDRDSVPGRLVLDEMEPVFVLLRRFSPDALGFRVMARSSPSQTGVAAREELTELRRTLLLRRLRSFSATGWRC